MKQAQQTTTIWKWSGNEYHIELWKSEPFYANEYRWNIYVHVYPEHALFSRYETSDSLYGSPSIPFYGGCTFAERIYDERGENCKCKVWGCDYMHLSAKRYQENDNPEMLFPAIESIKEFMDNA